MKKLFSILLTLCLLFNFVLAQTIYAEEVEDNTELDYYKFLNTNDMIYNLAVDTNGIAYVTLSGDRLAKYDLEEKKISDIVNDKIEVNSFDVKDDKLYTINNENISIVDLASGEKKDIPYEAGEEYITNFTAIDGGVAFLRGSYETSKTEFVTYTDNLYKYSVDENTDFFVAYKDGRILTRLYTKDENSQLKQKFAVVNKENIEYIDLQEPEEGFGFQVYGLYDNVKDKLYLYSGKLLYEYDSNFKIVKKLILPEDNMEMRISNDKLIYIDRDNNTLESLDINSILMPDKILKVAGYISDDIVSKYNATHPDIPLVAVNQNFQSVFDAKFLVENMKNKLADIYITSLEDKINLLAKQDYISPLETSEKVTENISRMYPFIQDSVKYNDKIYGVPLDVSMPIFKIQYNKAVLEDIGMSEEDLPKDMLELVSFMKKAKENLENFPEYSLTEGGMDNLYVINILEEFINSMCVYQSKNNMPLKINVPENMDMFEKVLDYGIKGMDKDSVMMAIGNSDGKALISNKGLQDYTHNDSDNVVLNLNLYKDIPLYKLLRGQCFVLNTFSDHKEEAMKFFEWFLENMDAEKQCVLYSDFDGDVPDVSSLKQLEKSEKDISILEEEKTKTENENEKKSIDRGIADIKDQIDFFKKHSVLIPREAIDYYKAQSEYYYIPKRSFLNYQNESVMNVLMEIFTGKAQSKDVLNNLDNIVQMDMLEGQ